MKEYLTISCNFNCLAHVIIAGHHVKGKVEQLDDDRAKIAGAWYNLREMEWALHDSDESKQSSDT